MQLHTGAEHFGNVIFRYSELTSQYHIDASIDVNRMWRARDKTIVSQSGTIALRNNFERWTNGACSSREMWLNDEKLQK
jgi:hypothetical protein